jgi:hypothetical protein
MPDWWSAEAEAEPGALVDLKIILARRLGLDLTSLLEHGNVSLALPAAVKFKRSVRLAEQQPPEPFLAYCTAIARSAAAAMDQPSKLPAADGEAERAVVLSDGRVRWPSLNALLRRCWRDLGIAVVHTIEAPTSGKGFDAASFRIDGRVVIVLAKQASHPAWALFWLAHELGHLGLGHVEEGAAIFDETDPSDDADDEEASANSYALTLLGGKDLAEVLTVGEANAPSLASTALAVGESLEIYPGHLILRFAESTGEWDVAQAALARLSDGSNVSATVNTLAGRFLDFSAIGDDSRDALKASLGLE